ncbi:ABC transporter ATP-binding protein [Trebonia kvetii]|uniref:ABC transporter ATP-binding protein n=1 Tax=Trebonia kvetii TaxID=2480626 RepID=A0A6P2C5Q2_9ACTN|nr:ABC transporter ATP-binding protein [Trebonia kvetii]TVZ05706.1 ABC transporter ATP-binding protein [Trebonia kvetii]
MTADVTTDTADSDKTRPVSAGTDGDTGSLDTKSQGQNSWRGIATEHVDDMSAPLAALLRRRSRVLLGNLLRPHRRGVTLTAVLIVISSLCALAGPWLIGIAIDNGLPPMLKGNSGPLLWIALVFAVTVLVQAFASQAFVTMTGRIGQAVVLELRRRLFAHLLRLSVSFHESYTSGRVISRQTSDVEAISALFDEGLDSLIMAVLTLLLVGTGMLLLDWPLALVVLSGFIPLVWLSAWFRRESAVAYRRIRDANALVIVHFVETFGGLRAVQAFRREKRNEEIFDALSTDYAAASKRSSQLSSVFAPGIAMVGNVITGIVLCYGGFRVLDGDIKVGVLASFLLYLQRFFDPLQEVSQFYNSFQGAASALEKLSGVLEEEPSVAEPALPAELPGALSGRRVSFDSVRFGYRKAVVLPDFSLDIPAGQTVALVGETGAGKTTVARLLARFYDPNAGQVLLDGVDLRELPDDVLRHEIVLITQESFLFEGSVAENIRLGQPSATDEEVEAAARAIGAHTFIAGLPDGYATAVGKRGGKLSAGQRQLISFCRAFIAAPSVLVLDEATALLDIPSERLVQSALRTVLAGRTALIIAHRLSTVAIADRVLVLRAGEIIEDGSPAELMGGTGEYAELHARWAASLA